jgi:hypothetical protein
MGLQAGADKAQQRALTGRQGRHRRIAGLNGLPLIRKYLGW